MLSFTFNFDAVPERLQNKLISEVLKQLWDEAFKKWQKKNVAKENKQTKWEYINDPIARQEVLDALRGMITFGTTEVEAEAPAEEVAATAESTEAAA